MELGAILDVDLSTGALSLRPGTGEDGAARRGGGVVSLLPQLVRALGGEASANRRSAGRPEAALANLAKPVATKKFPRRRALSASTLGFPATELAPQVERQRSRRSGSIGNRTDRSETFNNQSPGRRLRPNGITFHRGGVGGRDADLSQGPSPSPRIPRCSPVCGRK